MWSHEVPRDAAAISYFSLFALFPAILVLFAIVDYFLGKSQLWEPVVKTIVALFPGSEPFLQKNLMDLRDPSPALFLGCFIVVIWGSTWVFTFVENALNRAWNVPRRRSFWESRVRSIALLLLGGTLLLTSAGITLVLDRWQDQTASRVPGLPRDQLIEGIWNWTIMAAGIMIAIAVFFFIYKLMPDRKIFWFEALTGAIVATVLWEADWKLFVQLVPIFDSQRIYGTTGFIIALLTWVYTSSLITLYGANFSAKLFKTKRFREPGLREPQLEDRKIHRPVNIRNFPRGGR